MIDVRTEIQIGGTWIDVTSDVRTSSDLMITHGRSDYASQPDPCKLQLTLNNRHGAYSRDNPLSPYYGIIGRNTPIRVSVPGDESYLALNGSQGGVASTPHVPALAITGDLDVRVEATADWYAAGAQTLLGKWDAAADQRSWLLMLQDGSVYLRGTTAGTGASGAFFARPLPALPPRAALRATLRVDTAASTWTVTFYWARSLDGPWTQIAAPTFFAVVTSLYTGTAPVTIAPTDLTQTVARYPITGRVHRAEVRAGINGTVVAAPDLRTQTPGATTFTDGPGRVWTVTAPASIGDRAYRFTGEIAALPTEWDPSGADHWASVTAAGIKRRYQQGKAPLESALRRSIVRESHMMAYWPMEEGAAATQAYSPVPGVAPMAVSALRFAANSTLPASNPLPQLASGNQGADLPTLKGRIPAPRTPVTAWQARMLYRMDTENTTLYSLFNLLSTGTAARWIVQMRSTQSRVLVQDVDGATIQDIPIATGTELYHQWVSIVLGVWQNGANVNWQVVWEAVGGEVQRSNIYAYPGTVGRPTLWTSPPAGYSPGMDGLAFGHIGVFGAQFIDPVYSSAELAYTGESAGTRMRRLATEEGRPLILDAPPARSEQVGPQTPDTWLALIEEAAAADGGLLYEDLAAPLIRYRDRQTMYGQAPTLTLDYTAPGHVMPGIRPVRDDQATRNAITVTRRGGSSAVSVQETGPLNIQDPGTDPDAVGQYDQAVTLSLHTDAQAQPIADWTRAHGTFDGPRFPTVTLNLRRAPELAPAFLRLRPGDRADVLNMPTGKGGPEPVRQIVQGWTETLSLARWEATLNCTPAAPWAVADWGDDASTTGTDRWDTDGSDLATPLDADAIVAMVRTSQGAPWTTSPADLPLDITVGGERMTATAITAVSDAFTRTVSDSWGTATTGQTWVQAGGAASERSVAGGRGIITLTGTVSVIRFQQLVHHSVTDAEVRVRLSVSAVAIGASMIPGVLLRCRNTSDFYRARLHFGVSGAMSVSVTRGTTQVGDTPALPYTYSAGSEYELRVRLTGHTVQMRVWPTGTDEPLTWHHTATITTDTITTGTLGLTGGAFAGLTNVAAQLRYDNFELVAPQRQFTLTRAVNGITKSHPAGAPVTLADPTVWGL
ncbi:hypothetical protein ACWCXE_20995 [Streptomyces sp. NPDC001780]